MKFDENLRELRKQHGYSQEELAEKLHVSRQAVSKWENGSGYPELDKLMILCDVFRCSMDSLLKGDVAEVDIEGAKYYDAHHNMMSKAITFGVFMCCLAFCTSAGLSDVLEKRYEYISTTIFFVLLALGVLTFIYFGLQMESFKKKYPDVPKGIYSEQEVELSERRFQLSMVIGVGLILISLIVQQVLEALVSEHVANASFLLVVAIAVAILVYSGMQKEKVDDTLQKKPVKQSSAKISRYCSIIMLIATIIFLSWGFLFTAWRISWLVFPVGGILCAIVSIIFNKEESE